MELKRKIIKYCTTLGLDTVGFTKCRKLVELEKLLLYRKDKGLENEFEEKNIEKRINPNMYFYGGKAIISIAFPYIFTNSINKKNMYFSKYTLGMDYHRVVSNYLNKICIYIQSIGGRAKYFVDSNALPERYIANLCGIGFIGKNNMLITKKYGSYVFLGEIITDIDLEEDKKIYCKCGTCKLCIDKCPTKAINTNTCNTNICLSYITQRKNIEDIWFDKFNGRIFGCDTCQNICPYNREVSYSNINDFTPYDFMENIDVDELIRMDNKSFKNKYAKTSCGWRGKNILIRNALINKISKDKVNTTENKPFKSEYLNDYYSRLLRVYKL
ncbi:tRNA epoxyqueuosine(34) reductase QueG [Clostridium rectalis]|uniref:tRNA epoxyqueuosine(34) reductase QueG n=1 Tax=Clostridium rectalis TaxID=2040295 RepID=UPI000F63AD41|nr:tRNA epoxyqueuosine(34) reductase QueG [Clostridium rectalis]